VLTWFATGVGLEALWDQAVLRILPLQAAQDMPVPRLQLPGDWNREAISEWFVALQYRLYPALYAVYATALAALWLRSARAGRRFDHALLVAVVVWGGVYLLRALGRSDEHHLTTALPPVCILLAHAASLFFGPPEAHLRRSRALPAALACAGLVGAWVYLQGSDRYFGRELRGRQPLRCLDGRVFVRSADDAQRLDRSVVRIATLAGPDERVLDLTHSPLIHVLSGRLGPGFGDVVTPGVFADPRELRDFVARLDAAPPALVLWPRRPFDDLPSRSLRAHAPLLADWVQRNYERVGGDRTREVLLRRRPAR